MSDKKSFIENVNIVANSVQASTGDVVEDAENAKNAAEAAAKEAKLSATNALSNEEMSREWAQRAYNNPIPGYPDHFSSFHWAEISKQNSGGSLIFDNTISTSQTWSSQKISDQLNLKSDTTHNHDLYYEPKFTKNTAFNKNFGLSGTSDEVARADHDHLGAYEPKIQSYGTAFNKNFGTGSGDVAEGSHNHDDKYMPKSSIKSAYNKDFGTAVGTVAMGNHTHEAINIGYDNSKSKVITSAQTQGAIDQLDSFMGAITTSENTYMTAGYSVTTEIPIAGQDTPVPITVPAAVLFSQHASLTNGSSISVKYPADKTPEKKIEGTITVSISTINTDSLRLSIAIDGTEQGEGVVGTDTLVISKYLTGLNENGFTITPMISNLDNTNNVFITSISISWEGIPQGALVISGVSVKHNDTTDRTDPNAHPIAAITGLQSELDTKPNKPSVITDGNFTVVDINGNMQDSGFNVSDINSLASKVSPAVLDNIVVQATDGSLKDGGKKISDLALKNGSATEQFSVGVATADEHAVRKKTVDDLLATKATVSALSAHTGDNANPHGVTAAQVGAAADVHTHSMVDITGLTDSLNSKYDKLLSASQNNIVLFDTNGTLKDSGVTVDELKKTDIPKVIGNINSPLLSVQLDNALTMNQGVGSISFSRASTASYIDMYGVLKTAAVDEPRFEKNGLLIERPSTNIAQYSEDSSQWARLRVVVTTTNTGSTTPYGTDSGVKIAGDPNDNAGEKYIERTETITSGTDTYSVSVFVKKIDVDKIKIGAFMTGGTNVSETALFTFSTESFDTFGFTAQKLADGWYRISWQITDNGSGNNAIRWRVYPYDGIDNTAATAVYVFGGQIEKSKTVTSYIKTTSSTASRALDKCLVGAYGNHVRPLEGNPFSIAVDYSFNDTDTTFHRAVYSLGFLEAGVDSHSLLRIDAGSSDMQLAYYRSSGKNTASNIITANEKRRIVITVDENQIVKIYDDGTLIFSGLVNLYTVGKFAANISLGCNALGGDNINGHISNFRSWNYALSEDEASMA